MKNSEYNYLTIIIWAILAFYMCYIGYFRINPMFDPTIAKFATIIVLFLTFKAFVEKKQCLERTEYFIFCLLSIFILFPVFLKLYNSVPLQDSLWYYLRIWGLLSMFAVLMKYDFWSKLKGISLCLDVLVLINFISMILHPNGVFESSTMAGNVWYLGFKNVLIRTILPTLCLDAILSFHELGRLGYRTYFLIAISLLSIFLSNSSTSIVVILLFIIGIYYVSRSKIPTMVNLWTCFIAYIIISMLVVVLNFQENFATFFEIAFEKDATMSERVVIYESALMYISEQLAVGYGYSFGEEIMENLFFFPYPHPHNYMLAVLLQKGLLGLLLLSVSIILISKKYFRDRNIGINVLLLMYGLFYIEGIPESITEAPLVDPLYALFIPLSKQIFEKFDNQ